MSKAYAEYRMVIEAPAAEIYAILKDYRNGHQHILPKQYFTGLEVESGGQGAGTILRVETKAMGVKRSYRMEVREPEPGRVLTETDLASGLVTSFKLTPLADASRTEVCIGTEWTPRAGLGGAIEKRITMLFMRRMYAAELKQLADYVRSRGDALSKQM